jgi:hypothetical protein
MKAPAGIADSAKRPCMTGLEKDRDADHDLACSVGNGVMKRTFVKMAEAAPSEILLT